MNIFKFLLNKAKEITIFDLLYLCVVVNFAINIHAKNQISNVWALGMVLLSAIMWVKEEIIKALNRDILCVIIAEDDHEG